MRNLTDRPLYSYAQLSALIRPRSLAVVGASASKDGFGTRALEALVACGWGEVLTAVSPRLASGARLRGVQTVPTLADIEGGVDCVLVAVPAAGCVDVVRDAAESGCRSAIIFSSGFAEHSDEGRAAQERIIEIARGHDMRVCGPNTAGLLNYRDRLPLTFMSDLAMDIPAGRLGIAAQSAGLATHLGHVRQRGLGVSYTLAAGNSADVTVFDLVSFALEDDATDVVAALVEGISDASALARLGAKSLAVGKPIVMLKCGRTDAGRRAAVSHTGSLVGDYDLFRAAAQQAGIILVESLEEVAETAAMFVKWAGRSYTGGGPAVITTQGGAGGMAADAASDAGVDLPTPSQRTRARLGELMPSFAAVGNPIDTTAANPILADVIRAVGEDPGFGAVVVIVATTAGPLTADRPAIVAAAAREMPTPVCALWISSWREMPGVEVLDSDPLTPVFRSPQRCLSALAAWMSWHRRRQAAERPDAETAQVPLLAAADWGSVRELVAKYAAAGVMALDEAQSREVVGAAGLSLPPGVVARTRAEAEAAAGRIGSLVVAKVVSADIPHKAAAGGVVVGIHSAEEAGRAHDRIMASVAERNPGAQIEGVLIAESLDTEYELMCGLLRDPVFGPVVVCGAGGSAVEQICDVARLVEPVTTEAAVAALGRLRIQERIARCVPDRAGGFVAAQAAVAQRLAELAAAAPEIAEIDLNPIVLRADGSPVALDALVVLGGRVPDGAGLGADSTKLSPDATPVTSVVRVAREYE
jgi:acetate---CoA ligase (ADP-forming)